MLVPWKKSYDQPRQHIQKQRHYFANKGPSSQGYGFSSSHVWMWELDYKESWVLKNSCFWTLVLEKTLESPLDCKEIQPVHPKGNQSRTFIGRINVETETPILWPPNAKNWLIWKDPDTGKDWRSHVPQIRPISSVQFSCSVMSESLQPHEPQHARPPCPSPIPGVYSNPCPLSWWCHPAISSSVVPFSSCPQSFPASGSFPMSQLFMSGGQSIGVSASTSVLPMNTEDWSPLGWTGRISLQSKGLSRVFSNTTVQKHQFFSTQLSL